MDDVPGLRPFGPTIAEGVAINKPVRGKRILQAINETDGRVLPINEPDILEAQDLCAKLGYFIEPTSALVIAGLRYLLDSIKEDDLVLLPLTGNGLKGIPQA
jgi:threonine synthase